MPDQDCLYQEMAFLSSPKGALFRRRAAVAARQEVLSRHTWKVVAAETAAWISGLEATWILGLEESCSKLGESLRRALEEPPMQADLGSALERREAVQRQLQKLVQRNGAGRWKEGGEAVLRPSCDASQALVSTENGYPTVPNIFSMYRDLDDDAHVVQVATALSGLFAYEREGGVGEMKEETFARG